MQNVVLLKQHPSVQLAHLYEHLYCSELKKLFAAHGLYKFLDYALQGSTFTRSGFIEIDIVIYTPEARVVMNELSTQKVPTDLASISTASTQILAEIEVPLYATGHEAMARELNLLNETPWQEIDSFDVFDSRSVRRRSSPMYVAEGSSLPSRKITTKLTPDSSFVKYHSELLPLFWQISKVIALAAEDSLIRHGYYGGELSFESAASMAYRQQVLHVAHGNHEEVNANSVAGEWADVITKAVGNGVAARLCRELQAMNYRHQSHIAHDANTCMSETGVYIGTKGWKAVATEENTIELLKNSTIETRFGRQKSTKNVAEIL